MFLNKKLLFFEILIIFTCLCICIYSINHSSSLKHKLDQLSLDYENLLSEKLELEKSILASTTVPADSYGIKNHNTSLKKNSVYLSKCAKDSLEYLITVHENELFQLSNRITRLKNQLEQLKISSLK